MHTWAVQDAKARFSEMLDACIQNGPQWITRRGMQTAVLIPVDAYRQLQAAALPDLKHLLLQEQARYELPLPARGQARRRPAGKVD